MTRLFAGRPAALVLHFSLALILAGALVTTFSARKGTLHVREGESAQAFETKDGTVLELPFRVELEGFEVLYHSGTDAASDYSSQLRFIRNGSVIRKGEVRMNRILSCKGYRFYQTDYDNDEAGVTFTVSHDPVGIAVIYTGYALLLLGLLAFFFTDKRFKKFFGNALRYSSAIAIVLCLEATASAAANSEGRISEYGGAPAKENPVRRGTAATKALPKNIAAEFGKLYVLYHGRICPLQTLASDFSAKLYGTSGIKGLTDEQVLTGWMFYGTSWRNVPTHNRKKAVDAMDKEATVKALYSGDLLKIYPLRDSTGRLGWYSQSDRLPEGTSDEEWLFVRKSMDYIFELVVNREYDRLRGSLEKLRRFQESKMGESLPPAYRIKAERAYNALPPLFPIAGTFLIIGLMMLAVAMRRMVGGEKNETTLSPVGKERVASVEPKTAPANFVDDGRTVTRRRRFPGIFKAAGIAAAFVFLLVLTIVPGLLWVASGHIPFSNGAETMLSIAWTAMLAAVLSFRKFPIMLPFGIIVASLAALVSAMGNANPAVTQLMPVLSSPLLSVHVSLMMLSYTILAVIMINGICGLIASLRQASAPELAEGPVTDNQTQSLRQVQEPIRRLKMAHGPIRRLKMAHGQIGRLKLVQGPKGTSAKMARMSEALMYPALFFLGSGIIAGSIWANVSWGSYWNWDPKETWALITFLIASLGVHRTRLPFLRSPRAYHIYTLVLSASVLFTYFGVNYLLGGMHSYA